MAPDAERLKVVGVELCSPLRDRSDVVNAGARRIADRGLADFPLREHAGAGLLPFRRIVKRPAAAHARLPASPANHGKRGSPAVPPSQLAPQNARESFRQPWRSARAKAGPSRPGKAARRRDGKGAWCRTCGYYGERRRNWQWKFECRKGINCVGIKTSLAKI